MVHADSWQRKRPQSARARKAPPRHRKQPEKSIVRPVVGRAAVASATVLILGAAGAAAASFLPRRVPAGEPETGQVANSLGLALADSITTKEFSPAKSSTGTGMPSTASSGTGKHARPDGETARHAAAHSPRHARSARRQPSAAADVYQNPLRAVSGLIPERIDMGVDFGGAGPVYAIGDGVITNATSENAGWPGGGWITYQLTDGPAAGLMVYVAEDVTPTVSVGQIVTPQTVIANMYNGGDGIETGWAMPDGASALSQLPEAGGIGGAGPFPTSVGVSFEGLLTALGVPAAPNAGQVPSGILPPGYLTSWPGLGG